MFEVTESCLLVAAAKEQHHKKVEQRNQEIKQK
jgi:hypothetical protein